MEEVILSKIESIEKCLKRIETKKSEENFNLDNYDTQDIIVLNLQRACQQAIDLAMYITSELALGIPKNSAQAFEKLCDKNIITVNSLKNMKSMVGFRNVAVHQYQKINYDIVENVINNHLDDFYKFDKEIIDNVIS
ncbi:MAG: type VII toxin-antitoxin system HepT family RNase toxin [Fusobacteriota bacterium]